MTGDLTGDMTGDMTGDLFDQAGTGLAAKPGAGARAARKKPARKPASKSAPKTPKKTKPAAKPAAKKPAVTAKPARAPIRAPVRAKDPPARKNGRTAGHAPPPADEKAAAKAKSQAAKAAKGAKAARGKTPAASPKSQGGRYSTRYSAKDIEVLEGLEPVRRRPGMFIGGTDERGLHHLAVEIMDNAMDEAVAGHASRIGIHLAKDQTVTIADNGRGIPVDRHPKFEDRSALEVILTTLHSGGKFSGEAYEMAGGLHGVGLSVVNALSDRLTVEVARDKRLWSQSFARGEPTAPLKNEGAVRNRRGTTVSFHSDPKIFGPRTQFRPALLYRMARSKAYLFRGVEIRWSCDAALIAKDDDTPQEATLHFPGGLSDFLVSTLDGRETLTPEPFAGRAELNGGSGRVEWAVAWPLDEDGFFNSYCNTVPTPHGGTHELGLRAALAKAMRGYGELINNRHATQITADDVLGDACIMLSLFINDPQFQGQTKERLATAEAQKLVETSLGDHFDHWLSASPEMAKAILAHVIERAEMRLKRRRDKKLKRASATRKLRLPGKLADCTRTTRDGTEVFLVEGDSAGGSAKQSRDRATQAVLPLRGKILNVASATQDKVRANQELSDLIEALGTGTGEAF
ncbi:MAG: ATP-binding protein, partial [Rhodospirillales bacterium]